MLRAGTGSSTATNPRKAAVAATTAALQQAGLRSADCALVFASTAYGGAYPMIVRSVVEAAGTGEVAGCGSIGVIAGGREFEAGPSVAVLVLGGGAIAAKRLFVPQLRGRSREVARTIAAGGRARTCGANNLALRLFPDTYNLDSEPLLATLEQDLPGVTVVGGGATEDGSVGETFQFCGDVVSSNAVSGIAAGGRFPRST